MALKWSGAFLAVTVGVLIINLMVSSFILSRSPIEQHTELANGGLACTCTNDQLIYLESLLQRANGDLTSIRSYVIQRMNAIASQPVQACPACPTCECPACPSCATGMSGSQLLAKSAESSSNKAYLIIGIPTVSRRDNVDYLNPTLDIIAKQMPSNPLDPMYSQVVVAVMNNNNQNVPHYAFETAQQRYSNHPAFQFYVNDHKLHTGADHPTTKKTGNSPTPLVQKQTRDLVTLARAVLDKSEYFMFMEDDFAMCPLTLRILHYLLNKAYTVHDNWLTIKVSYGMNGFILRNGQDLTNFVDYLDEHRARRPPDHLQTEWSAGESAQSGRYKAGRPHMAYRYNLLNHFGTVSSLRSVDQESYAGCFHELIPPILFEVDAFKHKECGHDDIWPCHPKNDPKFINNPPFSLSPQTLSAG